MELPLVAAQPGIWLADKLSSFDNAYTVAHYLELRGPVDVETLCRAIEQGMQETDALQMRYIERGGQAFQVLETSTKSPRPEVLDLSSQSDPLKSSSQLMQEDMNVNVRLDAGQCPIRHLILQIRSDYWIWYQRYHHIQLDAYSFTALTRRMADIYSHMKSGRDQLTLPFAPLKGAIDEYLQYHESSKKSKDAEFWKTMCQQLPDAATLSPKPLNGQQPSKHIIRSKIHLNANNFNKLCAKDRAVSQTNVALALLSTWLLRLSNRQVMGVGFIFMRRLGSAALSTAGPFINVLPMPISIESDESIFALATQIDKSLKLIRRHQKYDSESIVRESGRSWEDAPLYGPVINFKAFDYQLDFEGLDCTTHHLASGPIRDLELVLYISDDGDVEVEYLANGDRYDERSLTASLGRLQYMLEQLAESETSISCKDVNIVLPDEKALIARTNATSIGESCDTLASLLMHQSESSPERVALEDENVKLTYREMAEQVATLAIKLSIQGVKPGDIVAVALPRSVLLSIALQSIVMTGATWLPLDRDYPVDRLQMMVDDAEPKLIITNSEYRTLKVGSTMIFEKLYKSEETVGLDFWSQLPTILPSHNAYIIYTSGSTGRPKGVLVSHRAIVNRLRWMQSQYGLEHDDVVMQKTPASFDVSIWEFFWPLITGGKLFMAPPEAHRDSEWLQRLIVDYKVTTMHFVPSMLSSFLSDSLVSSDTARALRRCFCSGEALTTRLAKEWQEKTGVPLYNLYGPTEAAVDVTAFPAFGERLEKAGNTVPIGYPMPNNKMHVLDGNMQPVPPGIVGDLYISGVQLAEGYLHQPQLTSERFIKLNDARMYRTGDLALWLLDGALEFHGRIDDQVKLRGQRLELGEIDAVLVQAPNVAESVTLARVFAGSNTNDADARQLVSYLVGKESTVVDIDNVRAFLSERLPPYMVPVAFVILDTLPIGVTGKLNLKALPLPEKQRSSVGRRLPSTRIESIIAEAFQELLQCGHEIYVEDDFFSLGGHSLLAVRLAASLRQKLDLPVTIGQIMQAPRIESLSLQLSDESNADSWRHAGFERVLTLRAGTNKKIFCVHPASGFSWQFSVLGRYMDPSWSIIGIQSEGILSKANRLEEVVEAQFKTIIAQSEGPYYLLGYSLGGTLAHALAARLEEAGKTVAFLGLLDTWPPETQNWDEKLGKNVVDQAVIDEMQRERQQFVAAQQGAFDDGGSTELFNIIEQNYASAVRLLATAKSSRFNGTTTLFVAERSFPAGTDLQAVWKPWTTRLDTIPVDSSHVDIISPASFETLGPKLNKLLEVYN